jgi:hypothetical protein
MNIRFLLLLSAIILLTGLTACTDSGEGDDDCSSENMSYSMDVRPILQSNGCMTAGCHGGDAMTNPLFMDSYESLKIYIDANRLLGSLRHQSGFSPMPKQGEKLTNCELLKIDSWIAQGAQNN